MTKKTTTNTNPTPPTSWFTPDFEYNYETWKKATEDFIMKMETCNKEFTKMETETIKKTTAAIEEGTKILKDSITYTTKMWDGIRETAIQSAKTIAETTIPTV